MSEVEAVVEQWVLWQTMEELLVVCNRICLLVAIS